MKRIKAKSVPLNTVVAYRNGDGRVYQSNIKKVRGTHLLDVAYYVKERDVLIRHVEVKPDDVLWIGAQDEIEGPTVQCRKHDELHRLYNSATACRSCDVESAQRVKAAKKEGTYVKRTDLIVNEEGERVVDIEKIKRIEEAARAAEAKSRDDLNAASLRNIATSSHLRGTAKRKAAYQSARFTGMCAEMGYTVEQGKALVAARWDVPLDHIQPMTWDAYRKAFPPATAAQEVA